MNLKEKTASFLGDRDENCDEPLRFIYQNESECTARHVESFLDRSDYRREIIMPPSLRVLFNIPEAPPEPMESEESEEEIVKGDPEFRPDSRVLM